MRSDRTSAPDSDVFETEITPSGAFVTFEGRRLPAARVVEVLSPLVLDERRARMETVLAQRCSGVALAVENLHHSHNGAACIRTAEALGVQDVVTVESQNVFPLYDETRQEPALVGTRKVTRLTDRWLSMHRLEAAAGLRAYADAHGMAIWGAAPLGSATLADVPVDRPVLALFGNESAGILAETLAVCDGTFRIPMHGFVESFNVSVSVGIVLADLMRRRRLPDGTPRPEDALPAVRREALLAEWLFADVRAAHLILRRTLADAEETSTTKGT
jgi:tRNA (guanosine-2'-O-)-methyltransferase